MNANVVFPSDFMLVLAMNPCPCGFYPDRQHCSCSMQEVNRYFGKVKGPVLDRIDICVGTSKLETEQLEQGNSESSRDMRARIQNAQNIQKRRFSESGILFNSQMSGKEIHQFCALREADKRILDKAYRKYNMSARGYFKVIRVARTIADLEGCENINGAHLMEAIGYRNTYDN